MPEPSSPGDRTPEQRDADHASLARLSDTLVPALVQKLNASGLGELEVREGSWRIRLRRPITAGSAPATTGGGRRAERSRLPAHAAEREARGTRDTTHDPAPARPVPDERPAVATSPAVGVLRLDVSSGARLRAGDRIGTVDLLGIPQDVVMPVDGTVVEILAAPGEAVEYGEPIATVEADPPGAPATGADGEG